MKRLTLVLLIGLLAGCSIGTPALAAKDSVFYCHPAGRADAPGTVKAPLSLAAALDQLPTGGTLYIQTNPRVVTDYGSGLELTDRSEIRIVGVGTGYAKFDYVRLTRCTDVSITRVVAGPSPWTVFGLTDCTQIKLIQCVGKDAGIGNYKVFQTNRCEGITFDGCYGFGMGRKIMEFYKSRGITVRRCFAQGGNARPGFGNDQTPNMAYSTAYNTVDVEFIDCWGTWDEKAGKPAGAAYGIFGVDANQAEHNFELEAKIVVRRCTAYTLPSQKLTHFIGAYFHTGLSDVAFKDVNAILSHPKNPYSFEKKTYGGERCSVTNVFTKGGINTWAASNWVVTVTPRPNRLPPVVAWSAAAMKVLGGPDLVAHRTALRKILR